MTYRTTVQESLQACLDTVRSCEYLDEYIRKYGIPSPMMKFLDIILTKDSSFNIPSTEMEFLDISLTKVSSMQFTVPPTGGFSRKPCSSLVLKIHTIKSAKQENSNLFMNSIL
jgi:hypothetical protein